MPKGVSCSSLFQAPRNKRTGWYECKWLISSSKKYSKTLSSAAEADRIARWKAWNRDLQHHIVLGSLIRAWGRLEGSVSMVIKMVYFLKERWQPEWVALVLSSENIHEEAVHHHNDSSPDNDSHLLSSSVLHPWYVKRKRNRRK